jgi:sporulation protein YlmC with PRC-barrel domain
VETEWLPERDLNGRGRSKYDTNNDVENVQPMKKSRINAAVLTTALSIVAVGLVVAQDKYPSTTRSDQRSTDKTDKRTETTVTSSTTAAGGQVMKINKASQLVGMTVKNQQGEKLGKIDDIVIDLNGDKVAYCVLSVSQGAFSTDKYHAVPLRAFQPSADGTHLTLSADKEKLAQAQGFDKDNWPNPSNPSWGAQPFWQEVDSTSSPRTTTGEKYKDTDKDNIRRRDTTPTTPETTPP